MYDSPTRAAYDNVIIIMYGVVLVTIVGVETGSDIHALRVISIVLFLMTPTRVYFGSEQAHTFVRP